MYQTTLKIDENTPATEYAGLNQGESASHIVEWDIRSDPYRSEEGAVDGCGCGCGCGCTLQQ